MIYYHVAPAAFEIGDDLLCWDELLVRGDAPAWKWDEADVGFDGDVVCLFESIEDTREFAAAHLPDGVVLAVDLSNADDVRIVRVSEGYPAAIRRIPACYISVAK